MIYFVNLLKLLKYSKHHLFILMSASEADNTPKHQTKNRAYRILIVDDLPKNIQVLAGILHKEAYDINYTVSGAEAIKLAESERFDLILLDIMMPEVNGFQVCESLKNKANTRDIPIIFLTAKVDTESILKGFRLGAQDYVTKPFNAEELMARVRTQLELKRSKEELQELNATKDKFFSIIAHDLKNPVFGCQTMVDLLDKHYDRFSDEDRQKYFRLIKQATHETYALLENLLEWSRVQTDRIHYSPQYCDLHEIANSNIALHKSYAEKKNISLSSTIEEDTIVYTDSNMITTVIRNLVANAIKFTHDGGRVTLSSTRLKQYEQVCVEDTGIGIRPEKIDKFFKIDVHHKQRGTAGETGTGLGLILCKEFIEKNGGAIRVESEVGKGSRFLFTLPLNRSAH